MIIVLCELFTIPPPIVLFSDQTPAIYLLGSCKPEQHLQFEGSFFSAGTEESTRCYSLHQCDELAHLLFTELAV